MRKTLLVLTLLGLAAAGAQAQTAPRHARRHAALTQELQLTEDQAGKFEQIMKDARDKRRAIFQSNQDRDQKRAALQSLDESIKAQLGGVLNADQMARFEKMHDRMREAAGQRRQRRGEDAAPPSSG